ncbi:MAG: aminopeptidase P family protein [Candidatus Gracilibacteria bacterium]|jgi:Xaa-Pro aminopeptidase|nr:aminopeptidase P family protein [Candidatus Gracilibacteria bacterium]
MLIENILKEKGIDGILLSKKENILYSTGFFSEGALALVLPRCVILFVSHLDIKNAKNLDCELEDIREFFKIIEQFKIEKLGFESEDMSFARHKRLSAQVRLISLPDIYKKIRIIKKDQEIAKIKKVSHLTDQLISKLIPMVKEGISELDLLNHAKKISIDLNTQGFSFDPIIAFGSHSACPHHAPSTKKLKKNTPIMIDIGLKKDEYLADMTRSFFYGKPNEQWCNVYKKVLKAHAEAIKAVSSERMCSFVHQRAEMAMGEKLIHALGHGVGLEIHEYPLVSLGSEDVFQKNQVFTIEPGIYRKNFGIRIENTYVLQEKLISLNRSPIDISKMII